MPINPDLLISAAILQDYFSDKDGTPMSFGTITCYQDNSRTTLKNWYYQSSNFADSSGNYTFSKLPNPLRLSGAGTICDINGVDTIPFFYPYDEEDENERQAYYITIVNHDRTNQITRPNFPYNPGENNPNEEGAVENYIINNIFWRNIGSANLTNVLQLTVAPSQHDSFQYPDIQFLKNVVGGQDTLTFTPFPLTSSSVLTGDITPEFYINHMCSNSFAGETQKCYQFPISLHVNTLNGVQFTVTIQAQNLGGISTGQNTVSLYILQDTGSGTTPPAPKLIGGMPITLSPTWTKYTITDTFPTTAGLVLSAAGDDALYLQVQMPLNTTCNINFTKPSIYLSNAAPTNDFSTYDQVDAIINSPRTGDIRTSVNSWFYYGWVPMNDGVIGLSNPTNVAPTATIPGYSRANVDTWPLFNLLWSIGKPFDSGTNFNPFCQMYNNNGSALTATNYGASAYADFSATSPSKALQLTKMFGRVMMGSVPDSALMPGYFMQSQGVTVTNTFGAVGITLTTPIAVWRGQPVIFGTAGGSLPTNIISGAVYYLTSIDNAGTSFVLSFTYVGAINATGPFVPFGASAGSNVFVNFNPPYTPIGEAAHIQSTAEVGVHTHAATTIENTPIIIANNVGGSPLFYPVFGGNAVSTSALPTTWSTTISANTPSGLAFNIVQPGTFYNMYMKL